MKQSPSAGVLRSFALVGGLYLFLVFIFGISSLVSAKKVWQQIKQGEINSTQSSIAQLKVSLAGLDFLTLTLIPDIHLGSQVSSLLTKYQSLSTWLLEIKKTPFSPTQTQLKPSDIVGLSTDLKNITDNCSKTWFIKDALSVECSQLAKLSTLFKEIEPFIDSHLENSHTYLVLFQNSEELRASGGFMGSFARITIGGNGIEEFEIQDIYEPDGQFTGYVPAPPGVFEYLSSGNGLRLPDANWAADFPSAAQIILAYFSFGKQSSVDGLIAINSSLIEKMLTITGDIYIPDYEKNISAITFTELARSNRDSFFPGSNQKAHFLTSFMNQIKLRFLEASPNQQQQLLTLALDSFTTKDTLLYSTSPELEDFLQKHNTSGNLSYPEKKTDAFLYLLESNVGINKSNKKVERQVTVDLGDYQSTISISFDNKNPIVPPAGSNDDNLNYANYQRVVVTPSWQLHEVTIDGIKQDLEKIDDNIITSKSGDQFRQIGFLSKVDAQTTSTVQIRFSKLAQNTTALSHRIFLQKQPGQKATPYMLTWRDTSQTIILDQDSSIELQTEPTR